MQNQFRQELGAKIKVSSGDIATLTQACASGFFPESTENGIVTLWRQFPDGYLSPAPTYPSSW
jgi:hypothetical protein